MADMMSTLRGILGDGADDKIKNAMNMLAGSGILQQNNPQKPAQDLAEAINNDIKTEEVSQPAQEQQMGSSSVLTPEGIQFLGQIKSMVDQVSNTNDSRSELLRSLRPFMRSERQQSIDKLIRIMNVGRLSGLFGRQG